MHYYCLPSFSAFSPTSTPSCYNGQFQSPNTYYRYNYNTSLYSVSGYLTGCVNGTFAPVCGETNIGRNELTFACYFITGLACKLSMCACAVCGKVVSCPYASCQFKDH